MCEQSHSIRVYVSQFNCIGVSDFRHRHIKWSGRFSENQCKKQWCSYSTYYLLLSLLLLFGCCVVIKHLPVPPNLCVLFVFVRLELGPSFVPSTPFFFLNYRNINILTVACYVVSIHPNKCCWSFCKISVVTDGHFQYALISIWRLIILHICTAIFSETLSSYRV